MQKDAFPDNEVLPMPIRVLVALTWLVAIVLLVAAGIAFDAMHLSRWVWQPAIVVLGVMLFGLRKLAELNLTARRSAFPPENRPS